MMVPLIPVLPGSTTPELDLHTIDDSASSEGAITPGEEHGRRLSIHIPKQMVQPPISTPFLTASNIPFEYPFPPTRPPLSTASSSSSINSVHGPPLSASIDRHIPNLFARLTSRSPHRRTHSANGLPTVPVPPRLRKLSGGHPAPSPAPARSDLTIPRLAIPDGSHAGNLVSRTTGDRRSSWAISPRQIGSALLSTPRSCGDPPSVPVFAESDDEQVVDGTRTVDLAGLDQL